MNAKKVILEMVKKEDIEAISIRRVYGHKNVDYSKLDDYWFFEKDKIDKALELLDYEFDGGYGLEEGDDIFVWTKDWIIVKTCYDGAEDYAKIPRHPTDKITPFCL